MHTLFKYVRKIIILGPKRSAQVLISRIHNQLTGYYWRSKFFKGITSHSLDDIKQKYDIKKLKTFLESQRLRSLFFVNEIYTNYKTKNEIISQADLHLKNKFKIFKNLHYIAKINWHIDSTLNEYNNFDPYIFYKDIHIKNGIDACIEKDIKVPWEMSRFPHLFVIGNAYQLTKSTKYSDFFMKQIVHWLDSNPYLHGVNWLCPMEVGLRAINWVIAFSFFKDAEIDQQFWKKFICSLYDHFIYLENNWEVYDTRTSNHYLSDLVGYLYLCWFFKDLDGMDKKLHWVHAEIIKEMEKQVFDEGASYEGSTKYHQLVTELFYHAYLMFQECDLSIPKYFMDKLARMFAFIEWCTPEDGQLVTIGDHDSGNVLYYGLPKNIDAEKKEGIRHFPKFGLSIIKNKKWHISLRHHAYQNYQPSGHFHNDVGSITLAMNGIPVFVDPGSYVYTPSVYWRNKFRSVEVHNTCYVEGVEPVPLNNDLFYLGIPENKTTSKLYVQHDLYKRLGLSFERNIDFKDDTLKIIDLWSHSLSRMRSASEHIKKPLISCWNFTLGPDIIPKKENGIWLLQYNQETLITLFSKLDFEVQDAWVSLEYGTKVPSLCLRAKKDLITDESTHIYLSLSK